MSDIRKPLVIAMLVLMVTSLCLELGSQWWVSTAVQGAVAPDAGARPGLGITSLVFVDILLMASLTVVSLVSLGVTAEIVGRIQGLGLLITSVVVIFIVLPLIFAAIALLTLMVGLLLSVPFGTAVYLAVYGHFARGPAAATLAGLLLIKIVAAVCYLLSFAEALKATMLVAVFGCSIGLTFLLTFLHGFVPRPLVSITDDIGAIVALIVALVWAIIYLVSALISIVKVLRADRLKHTTVTPR